MAAKAKPLTDRMRALLVALEAGASVDASGHWYRLRHDDGKTSCRTGVYALATATVDACLNRGYLSREHGDRSLHYRLNELGREALRSQR